MRTSELPSCMKHSGFAGLIPRNCNDLVKSALVSAHIAYMIDFGRIINPRGFESVMKSYEKQGRISEMAMGNSRPADDVRVAYLYSVGLFDIATFKTVVTVANELMREINADKISEDAIDAALLSVVATMSPFDGGGAKMEKEVFPSATSGETSPLPLNQVGDLVSLCSSLGSSSSPGGADVGATTEKDVFPSASSGATSLRGDATMLKEVIPSASPGATSLHSDATKEKEVIPSASSGAPSQSHLPLNQSGDLVS